jgi:ferredoxin
MTVIYYYSGTGNSLWTARALAERLADARVEPMGRYRQVPARATEDAVGLVFPVHIWGVPQPVLEFVDRLEVPPASYLFAVAVNAGQVARTLIQLRGRCARRGLRLRGGWSVALPSNYIPWGGPGDEPKLAALFGAAPKRAETIAAAVQARVTAPVERGPLWQRLVFTPMYWLSHQQIPGMDKSFWVDADCSGCGLCARICPAANIVLAAGRPTWQHHCEQCLACIQWCPEESIQFGKRTPGYARYHHPGVRAADLIADRAGAAAPTGSTAAPAGAQALAAPPAALPGAGAAEAAATATAGP